MKPDGSRAGSAPALYPILFAYLMGVALSSHLSLPRPVLLAIMGVLFFSVLIGVSTSRKNVSTLFWVGVFSYLGFCPSRCSFSRHSPRITWSILLTAKGSLWKAP
jgi:hypothetical protein